MKISTNGRYAIRAMIDLAEHYGEAFVSVSDVAQRQEVSEKYLETIASGLCRAGLLLSAGKDSGKYRLAKDPSEYNAAEILRVTEGELSPIACVEKSVNDCPRYGICKSVKLWEGLYAVISDYLEGHTLKDMAEL